MSARARSQRGIALLTAVLIVAIAAAVAVKIAFAHQIWFRQMENVGDRGATDLLRRGALHWASIALLEDAAQNPTDHLGETWAQKLPTLPVDGGAISVSIEDAQGRFNLNNLVQSNAPSPDVVVFQRLLNSLRLDPNLAYALIDWIDANGDPTPPRGAEDVDYLNLKTPYRAANQPLVSVDELRLVRGFDAKTVQILLPFVTVLPPSAGRTAINVNTASPELLAALANKDLAWAQRVADTRRDTPWKNPGEFTGLLQTPGAPSPALSALVDVKTSFFLVKLETSIGRHQRKTVALMKRDGKQSTTLIWHKPEPLIAPAAVQQATSGTDESAELQ